MPIYGVCAQLARIRGLTPLQLRDAWGMAMNMVGGTMSNYYDYCTSVKPRSSARIFPSITSGFFANLCS